MGLWKIFAAIGIAPNGRNICVTASVNETWDLDLEYSPVLQGALWPADNAAWEKWQTDSVESVSRVVYFKQGVSDPCLVVDTVPSNTTVIFDTKFFGQTQTQITLKGVLPAVIVAPGSTPDYMPPLELKITRFGESSGPPFSDDGYPIFADGLLGSQQIPPNTKLPDLVHYPGLYESGNQPGPAVAAALGLTVHNSLPFNDWRRPISLRFVATDDGQGVRLVMSRYFELDTQSQILSAPYYCEFQISVVPTTDADEMPRTSVFPADRVPTVFTQEQPADILSKARSGTVTEWPTWDLVLAGISYRAIQDFWNTVVARPYHRSIRVAAQSRPNSVVPFWRDSEPLNPIPPPALTEPVYALRFKIAGWRDVSKPITKDNLFVCGLELTPETVNADPFPKIETQLEFAGLVDHGGNPVTVQIDPGKPTGKKYFITLALYKPKTIPENGAINAAWNFSKAESTTTHQSVRIGAMDLTFLNSGAGLDYPGGALALTVQVDFERQTIGGEPFSIPRPRVISPSNLPVLDARPGGQDTPVGAEYLPSERSAQYARPPALVFAPYATPIPQPLFLEVAEDTGDPEHGDAQSPKLTLRLRQPEGAPSDFGQVIVLDPAPFTVAAVQAKLLRQTASNLLGTWSNGSVDGSSWQLALDPTGFALTLPPQAIAETMSKCATSDDLQPGQFSDLRLSPVASATLDAAPFPQQFVEPYWNLRRRLGFPGQRAPGSGLRSLRFELLYGLQIDVNAPLMSLAELQSRIGTPPGPLDDPLPWANVSHAQQMQLPKANEEWAAKYAELDRRLGWLEIWSPAQPAEFQLSSNVNFTQRGAALSQMRSPFDKQHDASKIAGGWMWGFESANILAAVQRSASSTGGELARPALSALGGWGWQKAWFDNNRTAIIADVAMGRTDFYSLERIGRIAPFWNTAKHVIVYERTVRQHRAEFSRTGLERRPVLRKVAEYVEILQPVRQLINDGTDNPLAMRFFESVEFPKQNNTNPRIPVDGAWGGDWNSVDPSGKAVTGWQVPLWRPGEDPAAYPKPHILSRVTAVPGSAVPASTVEHDNPDLFRFYTSTVASDHDDPDQWQPVKGIDFVDRPVTIASPALDNHNLDALLPSPTPIGVGLEQFTFGLKPAPVKVNLTAGSATAVGATLRNVVVMRGTGVGNSAVSGPLDAIVKASSKLDEIESAANGVLASYPPDSQLNSVLTDLKQKLMRLPAATECQNALNGAQRLLGSLADKAPCAFLQQTATNKINDYATSLKNQIDQVQTNLLSALSNILPSSIDQFKVRARIKLAQIVDPIASVSGAFDDVIESAIARVQSAIRSVNSAQSTLQREAETFSRGVAQVMQTPLPSTFTPIGNTLFADIDSYRSGLETLLRSTETGVQAVGQIRFGGLVPPAGVTGLPASLSDALAAVRRTLPVTLAKLRARVNALAGTPDVQSVSQVVADLGGLARAECKVASDQLGLASGLLRAGIDALNAAGMARASAYNALTGQLASVTAQLDQALDQMGSDANAFIQSVKAILTDASNQISNAANTLNGVVSTAIQNNVCPLLANRQSWIGQCTALETAMGRVGAGICAELDALLGQYPYATIAGARQLVSDFLNSSRIEVDQIAGQALSSIDSSGNPVFFSGGRGISLPRALVEAPEALGQAINRELVALHFPIASPTINMTPVGVLVDRVGGELKSLGVRMPSTSLWDGFIPDTKAIGLSDLLPDFSGLKLDGLFKGISLTDLKIDQIRLSHGIEAETHRAWLEAAINIKMPPDMTIFNWEVLELHVLDARFQATSRISVDTAGAVQRSAQGSITGNWGLVISGATFVTFNNTTLTFNDGHISFMLNPKDINLSGGLQFLSTYLTDVSGHLPGGPDAGVAVRQIENNGLPVGAEALLDLPLPPLDFGTFGIANVELIGALGLGLLGSEDSFAVRLMFSLAEQTTPFTLSVFVLGGGGWLNADCIYYPLLGRLDSDITISFGATARLAVDLVIVSGSVELYFGLAAEFHSGGGTSFSLAIIFVMDGSVSVLGILSIDLNLTLEVVYDGRNVTGFGTVRVRAKLGPFFSISIDQSVQYQLGDASQHPSALDISAAANDYHQQLDSEG